MTDPANFMPGLSDADIDRLLGHGVVPPHSPDFADRIVAAAAQKDRTGVGVRRSGPRRGVLRRAALRGAIVSAAVAATAAAAALTAVHGDVSRLRELPAMIFHTRDRPGPVAHPKAPTKADAAPLPVSAPPRSSPTTPSTMQASQMIPSPAIVPLAKPSDARNKAAPIIRMRTRRSLAAAHVAREEVQIHTRVIVGDNPRLNDEPHGRVADASESKPPSPADHRPAVQTERQERTIGGRESERAIGNEDRVVSPPGDAAADTRSRPGNDGKKPRRGLRARGWRRPFGRMGRF